MYKIGVFAIKPDVPDKRNPSVSLNLAICKEVPTTGTSRCLLSASSRLTFGRSGLCLVAEYLRPDLLADCPITIEGLIADLLGRCTVIVEGLITYLLRVEPVRTECLVADPLISYPIVVESSVADLVGCNSIVAEHLVTNILAVLSQ